MPVPLSIAFPWRRFAAALLLCATLAPSTAAARATELAAATAPPRFFIETIRVDGGRQISPDIVISESRLEPGRAYSELELLEAADRVQRLPFVLEAGFALARGSERGRYRLQIAVDEVRRFFFGGEAVGTRFSRQLTFDRGPQDTSWRRAALAGGRFFVGRNGVAVAAVGDERGAQVGYSRYRLFGRPALLRANLERRCCPVIILPLGLDPAFSSWKLGDASHRGSLTLAVPLANPNQSLRLSASYVEGDGTERQAVTAPSGSAAVGPSAAQRFDDFSDQHLELAWISDTRDDPHLPSRGRTLRASLQYREVAADFEGGFDAGAPPGLPLSEARSRMLRAAVTGASHWPLGRRQTLSLTLRLAAGQSAIAGLPAVDPSAPSELTAGDVDVFEGSLGVRHALKIWESGPARPFEELYWESFADVGFEETTADLVMSRRTLRRWSITSALTFRSAWGILRVGIAYVDVGRLL